MRRRLLLAFTLAALALPITACRATPRSETPRSGTIPLPLPDLEGRITFEKALNRRRSVREYTSGDLALARVGQLLWAAQGITSPDGKRTTPSARAVYPLEVYVVARRVTGLDPGVYRYQPKDHGLVLVAAGDRSEAMALAVTGQDFVARAPLIIAVVADSARAADRLGRSADRWVAMEAGFVVQDVYLQATALGLGTVMIGGFDDGALRRALALPAGRAPLAVMPVGRTR
jgi:SagB-type dehydrogenase family enzyme